MKKIIFAITLFLITPILCLASGSIKPSTSSINIEPGSSSSFKITATNAAGRVDISTSNASVASISETSSWVENSSITITVSGKQEGTATITVRLTDAATFDEEPLSNSYTISVTVKKKSAAPTPTTPSKPTTTKPSTPKSSEKSLQSLTIENHPIDFSKDVLRYNLELEYEESQINVTATPTDSKARVSGTGIIEIPVGTNEFNVVVTAEDGTKQYYALTITRKEKENIPSTDLKLLLVNDYIIYPNLTNTYLVGIPNNIDELNILTTTDSTTTKTTIDNNKKLKAGINIITIKLEDTNCETKEVKLIVYKATYDYADSLSITSSKEYNAKEASNYLLTKDIINNLKDNTLVFNIVNDYNGLLTSFTFNNKTIINDDINLYLIKGNKDPYIIFTNAPKDTMIKTYIENDFNTDKVKIYSIDLDGNKTFLQDATIENNYLSFVSDGNLEYLLTTEEIKTQSFTIYYIIILVLAILLLIGVVVLIIIKKRKKNVQTSIQQPTYQNIN